MVKVDPLVYAYSHGRDDGCEIAPECLKWPLVKCKYDMTQKERWDMGIGKGSGNSLSFETKEQIKDMVRAERLSVERIAELTKVSKRTVQRLRSEVLV